MTFCFFLKILTECSLFFLFANVPLSLSLAGVESIIPALICAAAGTLGYVLNGRGSHYQNLSILLLPGVLLYAHSFGQLIALLLPALYVALVIWRQNYFIDRSSQQDFFRIGGFLACLLSIPFVLLMKYNHMALFLTVFLLGSILLLRSLRQDPEVLKQPRYRLMNGLGVLVLVLLALILGSETALNLASSVLGFLYDLLITPIAYLLSWLVTIGARLFIAIFRFFFPNYEVNWAGLKILTDAMGNHEPTMVEESAEAAGLSPAVVMAGRVVVALLGLGLLLWFFFTHSHKGRNQSPAAPSQYRSVAGSDARPPEKIFADRFPPREPRAAVRYYYRNFLRLCGRSFPAYYNSLQVQNSTEEDFDPETLSSIRQTYIRARYSPAPVEKEDVARIREDVKKLRQKQD